ncbi:TraB/GumN family protein [Ponticaulis sp.]|uniref:TraB/GumN family protein n=1 Tax=Ponticaulis sp. TaxID=2020902 RepID=UPI00261B3807|nr:TraB/GumN family protein [Ponticaulis sp.]MDF1679158.1 TraB/GumN family protein [Ponticaulis sp.]
MLSCLKPNLPKLGAALAVASIELAAAAFLAAPAQAEVPIWVIEDADSTIYVTGTVHMLPEGTEWHGEKLDAALDEATEIWLEIPMTGSMADMQAEAAPLMMQYALSVDAPLSSRLTAEELELLNAAMERADMPAQARAGMEYMKPWVVLQAVGMAPLSEAGYDPEQGIDVQLVRMAIDQGDSVHGFETLEQQIQFFAGIPDEDQEQALRDLLRVSDEETAEMVTLATSAFEGWANGDVEGMEALFTAWAEDEDSALSPLPYDRMVAGRNADWAEQIDDMLAGEGVHLIAVGGGHLVGPDSLFEMLDDRGISASRY